jgi:curved DNA-binding protein CbpA
MFVMKDYYSILGVSRFADATEIKRAYRRLAVLYHPDKNSSAEALVLIKEINEAYDVLSDPSQKTAYDFSLTRPVQAIEEPPPPVHRDPAYKRTKRPNNYRSQRQRLYDLMAEYLPVTNRFTYAAFALSLIMAIDFSVPSSTFIETIKKKDTRRTRSRSGSTVWSIVSTNQGSTVEVPFKFTDSFHEGDIIRISSSRILNVTESVEARGRHVEIEKSIYGSFLFAPIALLLTSCFGLYFRHRIDYAFNAGIVSCLLIFLNIVIFLILK